MTKKLVVGNGATESKHSDIVTLHSLPVRCDLTSADEWRRLWWRMRVQERDETEDSPGMCRC